MGVHLSFIPPDSPPEVLYLAKLLQATNYLAVAILAVAAWEWLVCLPLEYEHLWRAKPSFVTYLALVARYAGLSTASLAVAGSLNGMRGEPSRCNAFSVPVLVSVTLGVLAAVYIMAFRAVAIFNFNRVLTAGVAVAVLVETLCAIFAASHWRVSIFKFFQEPEAVTGYLWNQCSSFEWLALGHILGAAASVGATILVSRLVLHLRVAACTTVGRLDRIDAEGSDEPRAALDVLTYESPPDRINT
ncbi:hypothetical protein JCM1840_004048 [Sporobolomyces johnsonii]